MIKGNKSNLFPTAVIVILVIIVLFVTAFFTESKLSGMAVYSGLEQIEASELYEFAEGNIQTSVNIPLTKVPQYLESVPKEKKLVFYCRTGGRSQRAAEYAEKLGISSEEIEKFKETKLMEEEATNSGMNVVYTTKVLEQKAAEEGVNIDRLIFAHMPSAERRDYKTIKHHIPDKSIEIIMVSPRVPFSQYHVKGYQGIMSRRDLIEDMLGDTQRQYVCHINEPERFLKFGYTDRQDEPMPGNVLDAYNELVERGFIAQLMTYSDGPDKGKIIPVEVGFE